MILVEYFNRQSFFFAVWFEDYPGGHLSRPRVQASRAPGSGKYLFRWIWAESNIPGVRVISQVTDQLAGGRTKRKTAFIHTYWQPIALKEPVGTPTTRTFSQLATDNVTLSMKEILVFGFKFVTMRRLYLYYFFPKENCDEEAQEKGFGFQTSLLYFLMLFFHQPVVGCRHWSVVRCWCWLSVASVGSSCLLPCVSVVECWLRCRLSGVAVGGCRWFLNGYRWILNGCRVLVGCWLSVSVCR